MDEYKNIEKDLNISIPVLAQAFKNGIWVYYDDLKIIKKWDNKELFFTKDYQLNKYGLERILGCQCFQDGFQLNREIALLDEYGKTWALTKEELVNKNRIS